MRRRGWAHRSACNGCRRHALKEVWGGNQVPSTCTAACSAACQVVRAVAAMHPAPALSTAAHAPPLCAGYYYNSLLRWYYDASTGKQLGHCLRLRAWG